MLTLKWRKQRKIFEILLPEVESPEETANFGDYPGDFILLSGDREIRSKSLESPGLSRRVDSTAFFAFSNVNNVQSVPSQVV